MYKKGLIFTLAVLLLILSSVNLTVLLLFKQTDDNITGESLRPVGEASICLNYPPSIESIGNKTVDVGFEFGFQVNASSNDIGQNLEYFDDTFLFNINGTGFINFTAGYAHI